KLLLGTDTVVAVSGTGYNPNEGRIGADQAIEKNVLENLQKVKDISTFCSEAELQKRDGRYIILGDPTEGALLTLAEKPVKAEHQVRASEARVFDKIPFDSARKLMSVLVEQDGHREIWTKGSPDEILHRSTHFLHGNKVETMTPEWRKKLLKANEGMALEALRVIGFAYRKLAEADLKKERHLLEHDLVFAGMAGMIDPPREEVKHAVASCHKAGIRTIVVTGDHGLPAKAIGQQIGLANEQTKVITGAELNEMTDET